jgi:hypothetical protein
VLPNFGLAPDHFAQLTKKERGGKWKERNRNKNNKNVSKINEKNKIQR